MYKYKRLWWLLGVTIIMILCVLIGLMLSVINRGQGNNSSSNVISEIQTNSNNITQDLGNFPATEATGFRTQSNVDSSGVESLVKLTGDESILFWRIGNVGEAILLDIDTKYASPNLFDKIPGLSERKERNFDHEMVLYYPKNSSFNLLPYGTKFVAQVDQRWIYLIDKTFYISEPEKVTQLTAINLDSAILKDKNIVIRKVIQDLKRTSLFYIHLVSISSDLEFIQSIELDPDSKLSISGSEDLTLLRRKSIELDANYTRTNQLVDKVKIKNPTIGQAETDHEEEPVMYNLNIIQSESKLLLITKYYTTHVWVADLKGNKFNEVEIESLFKNGTENNYFTCQAGTNLCWAYSLDANELVKVEFAQNKIKLTRSQPTLSVSMTPAKLNTRLEYLKFDISRIFVYRAELSQTGFWYEDTWVKIV